MKILLPQLSQEREEAALLPLAAEAQEEEERIERKLFKGEGLVAEDFSRVMFKDVVFEGCRFTDCLFERADFTDVAFKSCDFSNSNFSDSLFTRCRFKDCKGLGANFTETSWHHIVGENSNFSYTNFTGAKLRLVNLTLWNFSGASLCQCNLQNFAVKEAHFLETVFFRTPLKGINFTDAQIDGILVGAQELKGAIVTPYQASRLAVLLGLVIQWDK